MSARYQIFHDTHYHYDSPVSLAQQLIVGPLEREPGDRVTKHVQLIPARSARG